MFKRVEKRKRRQEEEEALGLDSEMKAILGVHDTDSDESQSSDGSEGEDSALQGTEEEDNDAAELGESYTSEEDEDELANDMTLSSPSRALLEVGEEDMEEDEDDEEDDLVGEEPPLTVSEALSDPFYAVTQPTDAWACIVCPGKLLKTMVFRDTHSSSEVRCIRSLSLAPSLFDLG